MGDGPVSIEKLKEHFEAHGQGHVFGFWAVLGAAGRSALAERCAALDLPGLLAERERALVEPASRGELAPAAVEALPSRGGDEPRWKRARDRGETLLREGRVAVLVLAGGQATRLGSAQPKGLFPIGPVSRRSLFELQAQRLRRLRRELAPALPWLVMTSPATDAEIRAFFAEQRCFGLPPEAVRFFCQGSVPSFDFDGRLLLAAPDRLAENPDGHGGCLPALLTSGLLEQLEAEGVTTLFSYQVDNPLLRLADAAFLGFHAESGAELSCKVVRKSEPAEKVGVLAQLSGRGGRTAIVEYTELGDADRHARDARGDLLHWAGSIAVHAVELAFARRVAADAPRWLPFHASPKAIPHLEPDGTLRQPEEPNGHKLERFLFDALGATGRVCAVEAERADEFSPVKNAEGEDSPRTARRDLCALYGRWLERAGIEAPPGALLELDHSRADGPEDLRALGIRNASEAPDIVRTAPGVQP